MGTVVTKREERNAETYREMQRERKLKLVNDLRQMANLLETLNDDTPVPFGVALYANCTYNDVVTTVTTTVDEDGEEQSETDYSYELNVDQTQKILANVIQQIGECEKKYGSSDFRVTKTFGSSSIEWYADRNTVCNRRVVGTKEIPARTEEIVEWDCEPISFKGIEVD